MNLWRRPGTWIFVVATLLAAAGWALVLRDIREIPVEHAEIDGLEMELERARWILDQMDHGENFQKPSTMMPGMPEWGMLPIPQKLLKEGVRDMLRISDGRMSGTSYGSCVLHVSPESGIGGPLALVQTGDMIEIDVAERRIHLDVSDEELARRREAWRPKPVAARGYERMFAAHIQQAHDGCDFDFLTGTERLPEPEIH